MLKNNQVIHLLKYSASHLHYPDTYLHRPASLLHSPQSKLVCSSAIFVLTISFTGYDAMLYGRISFLSIINGRSFLHLCGRRGLISLERAELRHRSLRPWAGDLANCRALRDTCPSSQLVPRPIQNQYLNYHDPRGIVYTYNAANEWNINNKKLCYSE